MKDVPLPKSWRQVFVLLGIVFISSIASPAGASSPPSTIVNDLLYPRSSERFFQEGYEQFEIEIQRLQNRSEVSLSLLEIDPNLLQQQQLLREEQEIHFPEMLQDSEPSFLDRAHLMILPLWKPN
jgi:hypothetical protein